MGRTFCYVCGGKIQPQAKGQWWCEACQQTYYDNPKPCVELALFNSKGQILMALRGKEPFKGKYDLPGGFVDLHETYEEAIAREIEEELGLSPDQYSSPQYITSYLAQYPWGKIVYDNIIAEFMAVLHVDIPLEAKDDVAAVRWTAIEDIDEAELSISELWPIIQQTAKEYNKLKKGGEDA